MNKSSFTFLSKVQDIEIKPNDVSSSYDGLKAFLNIPLHFIFRPPQNEWGFDVLSINGTLKLQNPNLLLAERIVFPGISIRREYEIGESFSFGLDERTISAIEKNRNGSDAHFFIELSILVTMNSITKPSNYVVVHSEGAFRDRASIHFTVPKSIWVEKILPNLGYQSLKLFEIPLTHKTLKEAYTDIISEFNHAEKYYNNHDYNKCVAHCRNALDKLHKNLLNIKKEVPSKSAFDWLKGLDAATLEWLDKMDKASGEQTNKAHHSGLTVDFTRQEAESIYLVTLGLLNFIAYL